jgi:phage tail sheath protein FI
VPSYMTPGVYVEEVSTGPRPIEAVGTSTAAFLGEAPKADARVHEAVAVNNWMQFVREFAPDDQKSTPLARAVFGFFENGGSRCFVVNVGAGGSIAPLVVKGRRKGIAVLEEVDEVAIVAAPGYADAASYDVLLKHCESMLDRVAILDCPEDIPELEQLLQVATAEVPRTRRPEEGAAVPAPSKGLKPRTSDRGYGAFYAPWLTVRDPMDPAKLINVPPSGAIAGIYARTDATRGVHKAPANEVVRGALNVTYAITRQEQGELNQNGINCIRLFPTDGIRVWGARTLAPGASEWRYLNVRRLFNMVEESISRATRWVVFEPNDRTLWKSIKRDLSAFLTRLWRDGALMGATPEEAFFVKCDEETNPPDVIDAGQVVTLIGIAPVKPAEFIVFKIGQHAGGTEVETDKGAMKPKEAANG